MADSTSVVASSPFSGADLKRAERFSTEPFILNGEDPESALAPGTARRAALEAALAELDGGREEPSLAWRQDYSLMLGLERLLTDEEPHLADGTTLSAHQVDALSGTLIALESEVQASSRNGKNGRNGHGGEVEEVSLGEVEIEGDEEIATDDEPLDWDAAEEAEEEAADTAVADDPGAARRFWFEHATGA